VEEKNSLSIPQKQLMRALPFNGSAAGERQNDGIFPEGTVNHLVTKSAFPRGKAASFSSEGKQIPRKTARKKQKNFNAKIVFLRFFCCVTSQNEFIERNLELLSLMMD
jgi:hypothetical protein